jgi:hypothetical protein
MSFFCLLWVPLIYLLRRSIVNKGSTSGGVWALILGSITAILQFFLGYFVSPGGFGFSRWLFGFIDIVSLTVIIPILVYLALIVFRSLSSDVDFANFALLWLIPVAGLRAIDWSAGSAPILLVVVPLLWTALAIGISFFIHWMMDSFRWYSIAASIIGILILPGLAASAYWALFSQQTLLGVGLLVATNIPLGLSFTIDVLRR